MFFVFYPKYIHCNWEQFAVSYAHLWYHHLRSIYTLVYGHRIVEWRKCYYFGICVCTVTCSPKRKYDQCLTIVFWVKSTYTRPSLHAKNHVKAKFFAWNDGISGNPYTITFNRYFLQIFYSAFEFLPVFRQCQPFVYQQMTRFSFFIMLMRLMLKDSRFFFFFFFFHFFVVGVSVFVQIVWCNIARSGFDVFRWICEKYYAKASSYWYIWAAGQCQRMPHLDEIIVWLLFRLSSSCMDRLRMDCTALHPWCKSQI